MYKAFGFYGPAWHAVTLLVHLLNVGLVYGLVRKLGFGTLAAGVGAAAFGIYPTHPDAVVWISAYSGIQAAFFGLVAAHVALEKRIPALAKGVLCSVTLALAVFSKEDAASLILVLPVLPLFAGCKWNWRETVMWSAGCTLMIVAVLAFQKLEMQTHVVGGNAMGKLDLGVVRRSAMFVVWALRDAVPVRFAGSLWLVGALAVVPIVLWKRCPALRVGIYWFIATGMAIGTAIGTLAPADRYFYIPSIGIALCIAAMIQRLSLRTKPLGFSGAVAVGMFMLCLTVTSSVLLLYLAAAVIVAWIWMEVSLPSSPEVGVTDEACAGILALVLLTLMAEHILHQLGFGWIPDWLLVFSPVVLCALLASVLWRKMRWSDWTPVLICVCMAFWIQLSVMPCFLVGILIVWVARQYSICIPSIMVMRPAVLALLLVLTPWLVESTRQNMDWYNIGKANLQVVHKLGPALKLLPHGQRVTVLETDEFCEDPQLFKGAALVAGRPDLKIQEPIRQECKDAYQRGPVIITDGKRVKLHD
ncbi:hypothetical protein LLG39_04685 [bacterium]|nr:hypothetical protein [bacterium]